MAVKTSNQHHFRQFQVRSVEDIALRPHMHTSITLQIVKMVKFEPKRHVPLVRDVEAKPGCPLLGPDVLQTDTGECSRMPHPT